MGLTLKPIILSLPFFPTTSTATNYNTNKPAVVSLSQLDKLETLGRGSKGIVYKVVHNITRDVYALKTYNNFATSHEILREINLLESIDCPYITRFHGTIFSDHGAEYMPILMEYMEAGSLQNLVKINGTFSEKMIAKVARQTLMGLDYLHNTKHMVHCDIKPVNLLVNHHMEVKVGDFGISKLIDVTSDQRHIFSGTKAYMAPERFDSCTFGDDLDVFVGDIWSFGLTLMELYIGYQPYFAPDGKPKMTGFDLVFDVCYKDSLLIFKTLLDVAWRRIQVKDGRRSSSYLILSLSINQMIKTTKLQSHKIYKLNWGCNVGRSKTPTKCRCTVDIKHGRKRKAYIETQKSSIRVKAQNILL